MANGVDGIVFWKRVCSFLSIATAARGPVAAWFRGAYSWPILSISRLIASLSILPSGKQINRLMRRSSMKKAS